MKKQFLTVAIFGLSFCAMAQTTKKVAQSSKPVLTETLQEDTVYRTQTYKDMAFRIDAMATMSYIIKAPGDVTPNFIKNVLKLSDSLLQVDRAQYFKIEALKKKKK